MHRILFPARLPSLVLSSSQHQSRSHPTPFSRSIRSSTKHTMSTPASTAPMPRMMYGTAWKKERTADLVYEAIKAGFRGIDTAAMKRHYDEALTGEGIRRAIREDIVSRKDLFVWPPPNTVLLLRQLTLARIQTKFTPLDDTSPYRQSDPIPAQIDASIASSLSNLSTPDHQPAYLDALVLHSPLPSAEQTLEAWAALQAYLPGSPDLARAGRILALGISNVTLPTLEALAASSSSSNYAPPRIVQNRFHAAEQPAAAWDRAVRKWCAAAAAATAVKYQAFWTLTGNAATWRRAPFVRELAERAGVSLPAAWYVLVMGGAGAVVLNGTTDGAHMREDLAAWDRVQELRATGKGEEVWARCVGEFRALVGA